WVTNDSIFESREMFLVVNHCAIIWSSLRRERASCQHLAALQKSPRQLSPANSQPGIICKCPCVHRETSPSHGENRGSSPLGSANQINCLYRIGQLLLFLSPIFLQINSGDTRDRLAARSRASDFL